MKKLLTALAVAVIAPGAFAELKLDPVFSSNMVLQQKKPITFFGTAGKGDTISVEFNGKTVTVQPDEDRKWKAEFPSMDAGKTNYTVKISDGKKKIELKDVLIGEVWFCSGQSNMAMPIGKKFRRGWSAQNCEDEVKNAKYPEIRYASQLTAHSFGTGKKLPARYSNAKGWVKCDPAVAHYFSATAYFFGRELHKDLDVPIGLINVSYSGSGIHTWISLEGYKNANLTEDLKIIEKYTLDNKGRKEFEKKEDERFSEEMREWHPLFEQAGAEAKAKAQGWEAADFDDSSWKKATVQKPQKYIVRWYRTKFELPAWMKDKKLILSMNKAGEKADIYLNGKRIAGWNADAPESEKKIRLELDPEQLLQNGENVLALRGEYFCNQKSSSQMYNIITRTTLVLNKKKIALNKNWKMNEEFACTKKETEGKPAPDSFDIPYRSPQFYSNLYNGMAASWTRLPVRGIIWYQGCRNAVLGSSIVREAGRGRDAHYYRLLKALIADWRAKWNDPELPFLIVQLAGFGSNWQHSDPNKPLLGFALIRDIQMQMIKLPNVGLATAIDIGESNNIHPANKQEVGRRLALEAERIAYGKDIVSRGPLFESAKPEGGEIRVFFKYADKGLKTSDGKAPGAFAVAGENKEFVWADAKIDGKTVVVSSPKVKEPKYVRYAYAGYRGDCNLQNAEGLPAYPFRSDAYDYSKVK